MIHYVLGANIKSMMEKSSCSMQLGEATDPHETLERIMIISNKDKNEKNVGNLIHVSNSINSKNNVKSYPKDCFHFLGPNYI